MVRYIDSERSDAMLMRKIVSLRQELSRGNLNPQWVEFMLQRIAENDHASDYVFREVWQTLERPSLTDIGWLLEEYGFENLKGTMTDEARKLLRAQDWSAGPDKVMVTLVTGKTLFLDPNDCEQEGAIREQAVSVGLNTCPPWVVPALVLSVIKKGIALASVRRSSPSFKVCLYTEADGDLGFLLSYDSFGWSLYHRTIQLSQSSERSAWLFIEPR